MAVRAVTGEIGSGKSTAARILARKLCCECFDADKIAKSLWEREDVKAQAVSRWGNAILDSSGKIITSRIAMHIFADKSEHDFCSSLIHEHVMSALHEKVSSLGENDSVLEIPLLPEVGRPKWIDEVIYITANFDVRAERCRLQRGWSPEELLRRENFLLPQSERMSICDYIIDNSNDITELERKLEEII